MGVGEFRSYLSSSLLSDAMVSTGSARDAERVSCVGQAVPTANWGGFAADPTSDPTGCVSGAGVLIDTARSATLFDKSYGPSRSWRGALRLDAHPLEQLCRDRRHVLDQPESAGRARLELRGRATLNLAAEENRPVYVTPASIVATSGAVSPVESHAFAAYGQVTDRVSDLKGDAKQVTLYAIPNRRSGDRS